MPALSDVSAETQEPEARWGSNEPCYMWRGGQEQETPMDALAGTTEETICFFLLLIS